MLAGLVTTAMAGNVISADPLTITQNGTAELTIKLQSTEVVRGLQFTLTLPEGVSVEESEVGIPEQNYTPANNVKVSTTDITDGWWALGNDVSTTENPRTYKFVMLDPSGEGLDPSEEAQAILKITFKAADNATLATTNVAISDIHMSVANSTADATQADTEASVTVSEFIKGDVNGDGEIDILDATMTLYAAVGKPVDLNRAAADVNGDNEVDIVDATMILYYSVGKITTFETNAQIRGFFENQIDPD